MHAVSLSDINVSVQYPLGKIDTHRKYVAPDFLQSSVLICRKSNSRRDQTITHTTTGYCFSSSGTCSFSKFFFSPFSPVSSVFPVLVVPVSVILYPFNTPNRPIPIQCCLISNYPSLITLLDEVRSSFIVLI